MFENDRTVCEAGFMSDRTEKAFYSFFQKWLKHTAPVPYYLLSPAAAMRLPNEPADLPADIPLEEVLPLYDGRRATLNLNIIIVWAGIGGPRRGPHIASRHVARVYPCTGRGGRRDPGRSQHDAAPSPLGPRRRPANRDRLSAV